MNAALLPSSASPATLTRGFGQLLWLYFSWQTAVLGCACAGLVLLAFAFASYAEPYRAYSLSLVSYFLLLGVPFLAAPPMLRTLIGHRSISMVPRLPLLSGIALLVLTALTALFLPTSALLFGMPNIDMRLGLQLFIAASVYIALVQVFMISQYGVVGFSLVPVLLIAAFMQFGVSFMRWFGRDDVLLVLGSIALAAWAYALYELARRSAFQRAFVNTNTDYSNNNSLQGFARLWGINLGHGASPAGTLLLAYPASITVRLINIGSFVLLSPLVGAALLTLAPDKTPGGVPLVFLNSFMMLTFTCGCLSCFAYGELGARARLLWLRVGGDRARLWQLTERQLWVNLGILAVLLGIVASLAAWFNASINPLHYGLIVFACAVYDTYRGLCARLYMWPTLVQALVLVISLGALAGAVIYSTISANTSVMMLMELGFTALAVLFRSLARARFTGVDWLVVKHAVSKRVMVNR